MHFLPIKGGGGGIKRLPLEKFGSQFEMNAKEGMSPTVFKA